MLRKKKREHFLRRMAAEAELNLSQPGSPGAASLLSERSFVSESGRSYDQPSTRTNAYNPVSGPSSVVSRYSGSSAMGGDKVCFYLLFRLDV